MAEKDGEIQLHEKVIGAKRVFKRLVDVIGEQGSNLEDKILGIAHCNCLDKALALKEEVLKRYNFKDVVIVGTGGISTVYANEGGLVTFAVLTAISYNTGQQKHCLNSALTIPTYTEGTTLTA